MAAVGLAAELLSWLRGMLTEVETRFVVFFGRSVPTVSSTHSTMPACRGSGNRRCSWKLPARMPFSVPLLEQ